MVSDEGDLVWDIHTVCAFVPSKAGLTKEVVFQRGYYTVCGSNSLHDLAQ